LRIAACARFIMMPYRCLFRSDLRGNPTNDDRLKLRLVTSAWLEGQRFGLSGASWHTQSRAQPFLAAGSMHGKRRAKENSKKA
jgi:hypothetical protein